MAADLLRAYLHEEYPDEAESNGDITRGPGWQVHFERGEPAPIEGSPGSRVPVLFIHVSGEREAEVARFLRQKCMRGGG